MSEDFRTTVSRGGAPLPLPQVKGVSDVVVVDDEWISYGVSDWVDLPDEFYLRVLQSYDDHSTIKEIANLVRTYGQLCLDDYAEWTEGKMGNWQQRLTATSKRDEYREKYKIDLMLPESLLHLWEGRTHLDALRFLRDGWIVASATGDLADYWRLFEGLPGVESLTEMVHGWVNGLNYGLKVSHARIDHPLADEEGASIYGASCLQLYNHIVEGAQYKICANESCGQIFVRQQGRSETRQRKSEGVKYCSSKCARAQAQRELRRRRAVQPAAIALAGARQEHGVPSLGVVLRENRLERQLDDRTVRRQAGVAAPVLVAIEADDYGRYEGQRAHMERWLTALCRLYGMDDKEIVARYRADLALGMGR